MLQEELKDANILHCKTICNHIDEALEEHLTHLGDEMKVVEMVLLFFTTFLTWEL